jgi:HEAT repeat protein
MGRYAPAPPVAVAIAIGVALLGITASPHAEPKGKGNATIATAPAAMDVNAAKVVIQKLASSEASQVLDGLAAAKAAGPAGEPVATAIETVLRRGATATITKASIETLGAIGAKSSSAAIRPYLHHRSPDIRRSAARALASTKGPESLAAYKEGLRSPDAQVRGYAAAGLGSLGKVEALPDLFLALDRNVREAAAAIGALCSGGACDQLIERLGKVPFDVMTSGIDPILFRIPPLSDEVLIRIIGQLREVGTPEAGRYLASVLDRWPAAGSARVRKELGTAVSSLPGGGK